MGKKKVHHEEHENHERWLVSYADFITLLFAFFVVMYSVSRVDNKRILQVAQSIKFAMHFKGTGGSGELPLFEGPTSEGGCVSTGHAQKPTSDEVRAVETVRRRLDAKLRQFLFLRDDPKHPVTIVADGRRLTVRLAAGYFFDPARAAIRPEVVPVLDAIAIELGGLRRRVRVEGHTDDGPVGRGRYIDNWDLSASRAASVANYVEKAHEIEGKLLSSAGFGATRPLVSNATALGRETNRRVEMVVELNAGDTVAKLGK
jgi:chemotaxis protein MotB